MTDVLVATRSEGKLRELRSLLAAHDYNAIDLTTAGIVESAAEDDLESWSTFEENAAAKAGYFRSLSGMIVVADDSGIEVEALRGAPGVHSKRWSGARAGGSLEVDAANNALLLERLEGSANRRAKYVCVAAWAGAGEIVLERGETRGEILRVPRGNNGFGYDPLFLSDDLGISFGEASADAKARVSHRARAFAKLLRRVVDSR